MFKYKVGDKIKAVQPWAQHHMGDICVIDTITDDLVVFRTPSGIRCHWTKSSIFEMNTYFVPFLKREPPKTELEWLDRIQENFKE